MKAFKVARRQNDKLRLVLSVIAAGLLIIAQPAWYSESFIEDFTFLGYIWTLFQTLMMVILIIFPGPRLFNNDQQKFTSK